MRCVQPAGKGFFPLDDELELLAGVLTPQGHECLVRLSGWMPFAKAAELLEDFMGMKVSKIVSQNYTQSAGAAYVEMQTEEMAELEKCMPRAEAGADQCRWCHGSIVARSVGRSENVGDRRSATRPAGEWGTRSSYPEFELFFSKSECAGVSKAGFGGSPTPRCGKCPRSCCNNGWCRLGTGLC